MKIKWKRTHSSQLSKCNNYIRKNSMQTSAVQNTTNSKHLIESQLQAAETDRINS